MSVLEHPAGTDSRRGSAIVFDPAERTLTTRKLKRLDVKRATSRQPAPKFFNQVDVFAPCDGTERLVATLNLEKLGWAANIKRLCGQISDIYVMESPDDRR